MGSLAVTAVVAEPLVKAGALFSPDARGAALSLDSFAIRAKLNELVQVLVSCSDRCHYSHVLVS